MKKTLFKVASLMLAVCMLLSISVHVMASTDTQGSKIAADFTVLGSINASGLSASNVYTKSGRYSTKLGDADLSKNASFKCTPVWTDYNYLSLTFYSAGVGGSAITLAAISNNPTTTAKDYYYAKFTVGAKGWQTVSLSLVKDFKAVNSPVGWNKIDALEIWPSSGGSKAADGTELYFDVAELFVDQPEIIKSVNNTSSGEDRLVIVDMTKKNNIAALGLPYSDTIIKSGDYSLKIAGATVTGNVIFRDLPSDWTKYNTMELNIYCQKPTGRTIMLIISSENSNNPGADYWSMPIVADWEGWKTIQVGVCDYNALQISRLPLGWDKIDGIFFWGGAGYNPGMPTEDTDTVLYLDTISLVNVDYSKLWDTDYVMPAQPMAKSENQIDVLGNALPAHPRLILTQNDFDDLEKNITTDPFLKISFNSLIKQADIWLNMPVDKPDPTRSDVSYLNKTRLPSLALAYNLTKDKRYANRLWAEVEAVSKFPSWGVNILGVGDSMRSVAITYDWMYNHWTEEQRRICRNGLLKNGYGVLLSQLRTKKWFPAFDHNQNHVTSSDMGITALAIGDDAGNKDLSNEVLNRVIECMPTSLVTFSQDGLSNESLNYWKYGLEAFFTFIAGLDTVTNGKDYGLLDNKYGFATTAYNPIMMSGPTRNPFNYGDSYETMVQSPIFLWLARKYDNPTFAKYEMDIQKAGGSWLDMAMYRPDNRIVGNYKNDLPTDYAMRQYNVEGGYSVASMRNSWENDGLFVGFKGGENGIPHGHLDAGTFVVDALGQRWVNDLGADLYSARGYFEPQKGQRRWTYYAARPEGHNTLVINPSDTEGQDVPAFSPITTFKTGGSASYGIVDMTDAYKETATRVRRGVALMNNRSSVLIQDEITTSEPSEIYSFMHTKASVEIATDGKSAMMTLNGKKMRVDLLAPTNASLSIIGATKLPTSPKSLDAGLVTDSYKKLAIHLTGASNPTIAYTLTPQYEGMQATSNPPIIKLDRWDELLNTGAGVSSIALDGIPLVEFNPQNSNITLDEFNLGNITATSSDAQITVKQAGKIGDAAFVTAENKETGVQTVYKVIFSKRMEDVFAMANNYIVENARASSAPEMVRNAYDGDLTTNWYAVEDQWFEFDLGEDKYVDRIAIAWGYGDIRTEKFEVETSSNQQNWTQVWSGITSGTTADFELFHLNPTTARYVRIVGHGNSNSNVNNILDAKIPATGNYFTDLDGNWAQKNIEDMYKVEIITGVSDKVFEPDGIVTKAQFIAMIARAASLSDAKYSGKIKDISEDDWYTPKIEGALVAKIIPDAMLRDGQFNPNDTITREEMASIATLACTRIKYGSVKGMSLEQFKDANTISPWAKDYLEKAIAIRLISGIGDNLIAPLDSSTRAQAATIIKKLYMKITQ